MILLLHMDSIICLFFHRRETAQFRASILNIECIRICKWVCFQLSREVNKNEIKNISCLDKYNSIVYLLLISKEGEVEISVQLQSQWNTDRWRNCHFECSQLSVYKEKKAVEVLWWQWNTVARKWDILVCSHLLE